MVKSIAGRVFQGLPYILVFIASLYRPIDADLGWHLKYGEYFFANFRILRDNIFSTQMPDYHWVNSSWATDILTYSVFQNLGFFGLTVLGALVITVTFFFFAKAARLSIWDKAFLFPCILYLEKPFFAISFRGQLLSLLFLGILFFILRSYARATAPAARARSKASLISRIPRNGKHLLFLLPLFLIWVNFHGQFILGLGLFWMWILFYLGSNVWFFIRKQTKVTRQQIAAEGVYLLVIFISCAVIVLINPFGIGVYEEAIRHFGNPWQKYIIEWMPFEKFSALWFSHLLMGVLIFLGSLFLYTDKKVKAHIPYIGIALVLFILSLMMRRYTWSLYLMMFFLLKPIASYLQPKNAKKALFVSLFLLLAAIAYVTKDKLPLKQFKAAGWNEYCMQWQCSPKAAEYMIANNLTTNPLTLYHWGGWLIWNYPALKPSIDGRMHLWRDKNGYSAFAQYYPIEQNWTDVDASQYDVVLMTWEKPVAERLVTLTEQGAWQVAYEDDFAGVFVRTASSAAKKETDVR